MLGVFPCSFWFDFNSLTILFILEKSALMVPPRELLGRLVLAQRILRETPVIRLPHNKLELYAKLEFLNGVGSIKDRPAFWILQRAIERGQVGLDTTVVESSSGNFACALATFCRILKLKFIPVIDPLISPFYEAYLQAYCTRIVKVAESDDSGSFLRARLRNVQSLLREIPDSYWTNQYENEDGMAAHYELTGTEICRAIPQLDYVFLGVSSAGTIAGVSQRLKEHYTDIRIVAVDAEGSAIFGQKAKKRCISGIGASITPVLVNRARIDEIMFVAEAASVTGCYELLEKYSLFAGGSTGAVYSAIEHYFCERQLTAPPRVLFLCCDKGTAYLHNVYDAEWVALHLQKTANQGIQYFRENK